MSQTIVLCESKKMKLRRQHCSTKNVWSVRKVFSFFSLCSCWCQTKNFFKNVVSDLIYNVTNNLKIKNLKKFRTIFFTWLTWASFQSSFLHSAILKRISCVKAIQGNPKQSKVKQSKAKQSKVKQKQFKVKQSKAIVKYQCEKIKEQTNFIF